MDRANLLDLVAPCSLLCYACISFKDGPCSEGANNVYTYSDGWGEFWSALLPEEKREEWRKEFSTFQNTLQYLGGASCPGCRNNPPSNREGWGCLEDCVIQTCINERGIDFYAECEDFPCRKAKDFFAMHGQLGEDWETGSRRIKEIGLEAFFDERESMSHYLRFKKKEA